MSIRIRTITMNGERFRVALCAAETDPEPGDIYLDDGDHYALAAKFCRDWTESRGGVIDWSYPEEWAAMDTQKKRDAVEELRKWLAAQEPPQTYEGVRDTLDASNG
jgi:hypothetical protein